MKKLLILLINLLLIASCTSNIQPKDVNDETRIQQNSELSHEDVQFDYGKQVVTDIFEESIQTQPEEDNAVTIEPLTEEGNKTTLPHISDEPNPQSIDENKHSVQHEISEPEQPSPPTPDQTSESPVTEVPPKVVCTNAWYDENQPCDWIPDNLKPLDGLGRSVPSFTTSQEAWNWGDAQMMDESSKWYMCGYNRMDGHTNDGTPFYYAYMKSCPTE